MGSLNCKYHPDIPARWQCAHCQIDFCKQCINQVDERYLPSCPVCQRQLQSLGSANLIAPFWSQPGKFFHYPMQLNSLLFICLLTFIGVLLSGSFFGFLFTIVLGFIFLKYCFAVIEDTAVGHLKPLPVTQAMVSMEMELPFKFFVMLIAIFFGQQWIGSHLGFMAFIIALLISTLAMPANIMVLAMEHSLLSALNPLVVFPVIFRIGAPYLFLWLLLFLLQVSEATTLNVLVNILPYEAAYSVFLFTNMFFSVVMAHLLGYVLYQYHEKIGFRIEQEADNFAKDSSLVDIPQELRASEVLIHEGKHNEALKILADFLKNNPADKAANNRYLKLLQITGDKKQLFDKAQKYISYLFAQNDPSSALSIFHRIHQFDSSFRPVQAEERLSIARRLHQGGNARAAVSVLNNLHVDFPTYNKIPEAYLLAAKGLCESLNQDAKAKKVLQFLLQKYPDSELQEEINSYYNIISQLDG